MTFNQWRSAVLGLIALALCGLSIVEGVYVGATTTLPGALARHTSAIAVAVTCLSYGHCKGFQSFLAVDKTLHDEGLNYDAVGSTAGAMYHDRLMIDQAIHKAATLTDPGTELVSMGPHEKGLSVFYLISMAVFGLNLSSLFYGFMLIFFISIATFMAGFYRDIVAMLCLVGACCAMFLIIPVVQHINVDVNSVHGSRYLPLLAIVPTMHMVFLVERSTSGLERIPLAVVQAILLFLIIFARLSGAWMIAGIAIWIGARACYHFAFDSANLKHFFRVAVLPAVLGVCVVMALINVPRIALDDSYLNRDQTEYRTFWHHLLVAANFNPEYGAVTGLYADPRYRHDDQVAYRLFQQELTNRGENLSDYLVEDPTNWQLRTTSRPYDYKWGLYEEVVRRVFLRQISEHPMYVLSSFAIYEPIAMYQQFFNGFFVPPLAATLLAIFFIAVAGYFLAGVSLELPPLLIAAGSMFFFLSLLPAEASGVMPLRLVEPAFVVYLGMSIVGVRIASHLASTIRSSTIARLNKTASETAN
jgi:hypothetical protein